GEPVLLDGLGDLEGERRPDGRVEELLLDLRVRHQGGGELVADAVLLALAGGVETLEEGLDVAVLSLKQFGRLHSELPGVVFGQRARRASLRPRSARSMPRRASRP